MDGSALNKSSMAELRWSMTKRELDERWLFFNPEIVFDGTPGGIKLLMTVDAFNGHVNWSVKEGDHYTDFKDFEEARDYYLKVIGDQKENIHIEILF